MPVSETMLSLTKREQKTETLKPINTATKNKPVNCQSPKPGNQGTLSLNITPKKKAKHPDDDKAETTARVEGANTTSGGYHCREQLGTRPQTPTATNIWLHFSPYVFQTSVSTSSHPVVMTQQLDTKAEVRRDFKGSVATVSGDVSFEEFPRNFD